MEFKIRQCGCGTACDPFPVSRRAGIKNSEWYCSSCHKSYPMSQDDATRIFAFQEQQGRK